MSDFASRHQIGRSTASSPEPGRRARAARARALALDDVALVAAMVADDELAWAEFFRRYRPMLLAYARRARPTAGVSEAEILDALVDDLLVAEAERLTRANAPVVTSLTGYLVRAAQHRLINLRRDGARRARRYGDAAGVTPEGAVVESLCSEYMLRLSGGHAAVCESSAESFDAGPALRLAAVIRAATTTDEQSLLAWIAQRVPHRTIASWLGVSYDAATKRIWRLSRRLRGVVVHHTSTLDAGERREVERFLRRAGALPPLVAAPSVPVAPTRAPSEPATHLDDHG